MCRDETGKKKFKIDRQIRNRFVISFLSWFLSMLILQRFTVRILILQVFVYTTRLGFLFSRSLYKQTRLQGFLSPGLCIYRLDQGFLSPGPCINRLDYRVSFLQVYVYTDQIRVSFLQVFLQTHQVRFPFSRSLYKLTRLCSLSPGPCT